ncbi:MAG: hypothetical protein AB1512_06840 [Thermodesulfobacteriota bacterium]
MHSKAVNWFSREQPLAENNPGLSMSILVSKALTLKEQIAEVNRLLSEWLEGLNVPFDHERDGLFLTEYRGNGREWLCRYEIFEKYPN